MKTLMKPKKSLGDAAYSAKRLWLAYGFMIGERKCFGGSGGRFMSKPRAQEKNQLHIEHTIQKEIVVHDRKSYVSLIIDTLLSSRTNSHRRHYT
jgi:hypothetical protein